MGIRRQIGLSRRVQAGIPACRPWTIPSGLVALLLIALPRAPAQAPKPPASPHAAEGSRPEVVFRSRVDLVSVPVVVRDAHGQAMGGLAREDFHLFDGGKPQTISKFSAEKFGQSVEVRADAGAPAALAQDVPAPPGSVTPVRYVAFMFDDTHLTFANLVRVRAAAWRFIQSFLRPTERAAIATTSGLVTLDFTSDRDRLHETLNKIFPQNPIVNVSMDCPPISVYQADLIYNKNDSLAITTAITELGACTNSHFSYDEGLFRVRSASRMVLGLADRYLLSALNTLDALIRKMETMSGQRSIVLVSPGFQVFDERRWEESNLFERAIRADVVINALDARGLYTNILDASERVNGSIMAKGKFKREEALTARATLAETAANTGGRFYENSNDLDEGFARLAAAPEFIYVLGFNPQDLKPDGKFHALKITLKNPKGFTVEARRGYYAPRQAAGPAERSKAEIQEAFFGRDETRDIPVVIQTKFVKPSAGKATLTVSAWVDLKQIPFQKADGLNREDLTTVTGVFDADGNYVAGTQKVAEMRLRDETLQALLKSGITVTNTFDVTPGTYLVRFVVRDAAGQTLAAQNAVAEIP